MAKVVKFVKTIRNNWKKTIFFSGLAAYGVKYVLQKYDESLMRNAYCKEAKKYGEQPIFEGGGIRRITVFLNPASSSGKGKALYDKNVAPLLHLAGLEITLVKTEYEGQAKQYMEVLDLPTTDAVLVAGGDGTLAEVVTGLLKREDQDKAAKLPIGVLPVGKTNTLAQTLFYSEGSHVRCMLESAMSVVTGSVKPLDIMSIKGDDNKSVYAVTALEWGGFTNAEKRKSKYWYFGPLKHRWSYVWTTVRNWPCDIAAQLSYVHPCDGCSRCYQPPPPPQWRWWHILLPPKQIVPKKDYSNIDNPECGQEHSKDIRSIQLETFTCNSEDIAEEDKCLQIILGPKDISKTEFIKEGWQRMNDSRTIDLYERLKVQRFVLSPQLSEGQESWFTIDNEEFEAMPIEVNLMKEKLMIYSGNSTAPAVVHRPNQS